MLAAALCAAMCLTGTAFMPLTVKAADRTEAAAEKGGRGEESADAAEYALETMPEEKIPNDYLDDNGVHVYAETPGDTYSEKYEVKVNETKVPAVVYNANGNNFDIARFATNETEPEITVTVPNIEIETVKVYPERYYSPDSLSVSADRHTLTFRMSEKSNLRYAFVMINGGPADQAGKPYLALINDPVETDKPDPDAANVLDFAEFSEAYMAEHPNSEVQTSEPAGTTEGGTAYEAGKLVSQDTKDVRYPDQRIMREDDLTYALQAALDEIYAEGSPYDTLYFPAGTYICSGLEIRNRNGKDVTIYMEEGALVKNRIQECMQAMEPAIGIWDSSDITISGRGIFDGNGVANYSLDRHDAKDSCHQGGVMIMRSSNITFNDTYVRDAKQWNWESHGSKGCTLNNIKGLTPYNQPWVDGLDMASAQDLTINGALTLGNDDNFASGHYNPSDGFTNTVPGYDQYNADCKEWDTGDSFNVSVNNTLGWSYAGGNGVRMGHNCYGHALKNYTFTNVNTTNFQGGDRGITIQNNTGTYPRYESIVFNNCSFDTTRVGTNFQIMGSAGDLIGQVTLDNCWFSNGNASSQAENIESLTIRDLYIGGEKVEYSNFANLTTGNIMDFDYDWKDNAVPAFTAPEQTSYTVKVGEKLEFQVAASDADADDTVTLSAAGLPDGAQFDTESGTLTWTPAENQLGEYQVTLTAQDNHGAKTTRTLSFTVNDKVGNSAPVFDAFEDAPYTVKTGESLQFTVSASDADGDAVTLAAEGLPRGADFDAATGAFTWTPSASQEGEQVLAFTATDPWGASARAEVVVTVEAGNWENIDVSASEDSYLAGWKTEKNNNYSDNEYLRTRRMDGAAADPDKYGLWGEKITSTSDSGDAKISVLKFDAAQVKENLENLEKAELELTLINRRDSKYTGEDRLMAVSVTGGWNASDVTWNTHPEWNTDQIFYSEPFKVDSNGSVKNDVSIVNSSYDGTKATIDVTELVKNLPADAETVSIAVCEEKGYELAFASAEGSAKLEEDKDAAPVLRLTVKKPLGPEVEAGRLSVSEDAFAGSWGTDQTKNFGDENFVRVAYGRDSTGVLGTDGGSDNKVTYLKFDLSSLNTDSFDRVKLQMTLLGVRREEAKNHDTQILVGMAEDTSWSEGELTWQNKPAVETSEANLTVSDTFNTGTVVNNDPNLISAPEGTVVNVDVTRYVLAALEEGQDTLTLVVNADNKDDVLMNTDVNRYYFVSKEGAAFYEGGENMAPALVLTKYEPAGEKELTDIQVTGNPEKTSYRLGEAFDPTGLEVTASYSDGSKEVIDARKLEIAGFDSCQPGTKNMTVSYEGKTASFEVNVTEELAEGLNLKELKLDTPPAKTEYQIGEKEISLAGMKLTAVYEGAAGDVLAEISAEDEGIAISGFDSSRAMESQEITLTFAGKSVTFTVTIKEAPHVHTMKKVEAKPATCTENGNAEYYICEGCGRYFADEAGEKEIVLADTVIASSGHVWDDGKVTKEPTETEEGIRTYTCTVCGETYTEPIDRLEPSKDPSQDGQGSDTDNQGGSDTVIPGEQDGNSSGTGTSGNSGTAGQSGSHADGANPVKTGDESMTPGWILALIASAGAGSGALIYRRRKEQA